MMEIQYVSSWYLTSVTFPTQESLTFTYATGYEQSVKYGADSDTQLLCSTGNPQSQPLDKYTVPDVVHSTLVLVGIKGKNFTVDFSSSDRADDYNLVRLDTLTIRDDANPENPITTWSLGYAYDGGGVLQTADGLAGLQSERLQLHTLTRTGEPPYRFDYYKAPPLTGFAPTICRQDHWGFANNNVKPTSAQSEKLRNKMRGWFASPPGPLSEKERGRRSQVLLINFPD